MVLENFKSYKGRIEIGPFHKSFTSIVGPNGSGKSNVIDAMLFVFGFKAKKMRQEKLSGLIHSSDATEGVLDYCSVEVHFHEITDYPQTDRFDVVPDTDLVIARTATRSNTSKYTINGKTSSYTEVTALLRERGIDLDHKRFLILQGEVESISQMKPKAQSEHEDGLLEYLEDIIGTSRYNQPIKDAQLKLDEMEEARAEKLNKVRISEGEVKGLEGQKNEAEDYLQGENELVRIKNQVLQLWIYKAQVELERAQTETAEIRQKMTEIDNQMKGAQIEVKSIGKQFDGQSKEYTALQSKIAQSNNQLAAFEKDYIQMEEKKRHLKNKKKKLEKSIEKDNHSKSECEIWLGNHDSDVEKKTLELEQLQQNLNKATEELDKIRNSLKGKTEKFQLALDKKKAELTPWNDQLNEKRSEIKLLESQLRLLEEKSGEGERSKDQLQNELDQKMAEIDQKKQDLLMQEQRLANDSQKQKELLSQLSKLQQNEEKIRASYVDCSQSVENAKASMQAAASRDLLMKTLLDERDSGRLPGIFGRLGELGTIDKKYDVSISSAYMDKLKWIVVDKVSTAERCVKLLKQRNAGRASFIVIERTDQFKERLDTPENVPRLIDLIKTKDKNFKRAFYYVVRDTLVADDLDQANRVAFGKTRWKVVTLDGKVIDRAGTMSGGGNRILRGGMSSKVVEEVKPEELTKLEKVKRSTDEELRLCINEIQDCELELDQLKVSLPQTQDRIQMLQGDIAAAEKLILSIEQSLQELSGKRESQVDFSQEIAALEKKLVKCQKEESALEQKAEVIQNQIAEIQQSIMDVGGDELRRQNLRVKDIEDQIKSCEEAIARSANQKKTSEKNLQKLLKSIDKLTGELNDIDAELADIDTSVKIKMEEANDLQKNCEEFKIELQQLKGVMDQSKQQLDEQNDSLAKLKASKVDIDNNLGLWSKAVQDNQKRIQQWQDQLKNLKLTKLNSEMSMVLPVFDQDALDGTAVQPLERELAILQERLSEMKPNLTVLEEYRERNNAYIQRIKELEGSTAERDKAKLEFDSLRKRRLEEFMDGFSKISLKLKEMYQMITLGGNAELELVDSLDPFSEGILFSVMPPKKSWKNISNLSGGEKTLSSLALVFALHHFKPTPLYVMDEIDAALDFRNVSIIANYIKERTKNAQFVIISLRNNMFELADRLVGIYKTNNCTKTVAINPNAVDVAVKE
ncbi:hypothetical protein MIR68_012489 [Amoeboaphelidium protococcarum]|nr:hypothetical protein MIR68_012489 [Amoeboaphelidium protococcarum]